MAKHTARPAAPGQWWRSTVYYIRGMYHYVDAHPIYLLAAGIAFNVLLCVVPLLFLLTDVIGRIIEWKPLLDLLERELAQLVPNASYRTTLMDTVRLQIDSITEHGGILGIVGLLGAVWSSTALFSSVRTAVNGIYGFRPMRFFALYKVYDVLLLLLMGVLVVSVALIFPLSALGSELGHTIFMPRFADFLDSATPFIVTLTATFLLFLLVYRFLSHKPIPLRSALIGAAAATVAWEGARRAFTWYLAHFPTLGVLYGAYTFLVIAALWLYYSALVLILGAILVRLHWEKHNHIPRGE